MAPHGSTGREGGEGCRGRSARHSMAALAIAGNLDPNSDPDPDPNSDPDPTHPVRDDARAVTTHAGGRWAGGSGALRVTHNGPRDGLAGDTPGLGAPTALGRAWGNTHAGIGRGVDRPTISSKASAECDRGAHCCALHRHATGTRGSQKSHRASTMRCWEARGQGKSACRKCAKPPPQHPRTTDTHTARTYTPRVSDPGGRGTPTVHPAH
jgi:hypothetical protein